MWGQILGSANRMVGESSPSPRQACGGTFVVCKFFRRHTNGTRIRQNGQNVDNSVEITAGINKHLPAQRHLECISEARDYTTDRSMKQL